MTASTLVSFRHVRKSWQQVTALQNFSLDIAAGELVVLVGSSGCGKSTLLRMLIGLEPVTQGEIRINGEPVRGVGKERGIVFQEPRLFPWLTVIDNVMLGLADEKLSRGEKRQRALAMLERVQLQEFAHALPSRLSGGMAQRVAIARGLIASPQILMLDERLRRAGCPDAPYPAAGAAAYSSQRGDHHATGDPRCGRGGGAGRPGRGALSPSGSDS